jgi:hypothetical protein
MPRFGETLSIARFSSDSARSTRRRFRPPLVEGAGEAGEFFVRRLKNGRRNIETRYSSPTRRCKERIQTAKHSREFGGICEPTNCFVERLDKICHAFVGVHASARARLPRSLNSNPETIALTGG